MPMPSVNYNLKSFVSIEELYVWETEQGPKEGILNLHEWWGELFRQCKSAYIYVIMIRKGHDSCNIFF